MYAWGKLGHRVVAKVAENHLTAEAKQLVSIILKGKSLPQISTWMDDIKSDPNKELKRFRTWHYIDEGKQNKKGDLLVGLDFATNILTKRDSFNEQEQFEALAILVHLMGDLHQPLHVGNGLDWGANKCYVNWYSKYRRTSLHKVWDNYLPSSTGLSYSEFAEFIDHVDKDDENRILRGTTRDWMNESRKLHAEIYPESLDGKWHSYCGIPKSQPVPTLSYKYVYRNTPIIEKQMLQAGIRLAGLLNKIASVKS